MGRQGKITCAALFPAKFCVFFVSVTIAVNV
jgi:hypothetical protein